MQNAANLMAVMTLALQSGFTPGDFVCFHDFYGVSGRLERIPAPSGDSGARGAGVGIFVDYAHTPDALVRAQEALRDAGFARVITVFGCGGDRDRTKRPLMGKAVADASDVAVVTSDNPRTEDPEAIIDDIMPGLADAAEVHPRKRPSQGPGPGPRTGPARATPCWWRAKATSRTRSSARSNIPSAIKAYSRSCSRANDAGRRGAGRRSEFLLRPAGQAPVVTGVASDSRAVKPGDLFVCVPGERTDGHDHAAEAVRAGAVAVLAERDPFEGEVSARVLLAPVLLADNSVAALGRLGHAWRAAFRGKVVGVTGTAGQNHPEGTSGPYFGRGAAPRPATL